MCGREINRDLIERCVRGPGPTSAASTSLRDLRVSVLDRTYECLPRKPKVHPTSNLRLRHAARSDRGFVRANNEDALYAGARLTAVADGFDGAADASRLAINALAPLDEGTQAVEPFRILDEAVCDGNSKIAAHVARNPWLRGLGTTLTAILFTGSQIALAHIGHSRGYLLRDGELSPVTKDDTVAQMLVDGGYVSRGQALGHPGRSVITRALTGHGVEPALTQRQARAGDRYLLCTRGLWDPVGHAAMRESLLMSDVAESADRLVELALYGGGPDNVSVIVADVADVVDASTPSPGHFGQRCFSTR